MSDGLMNGHLSVGGSAQGSGSGNDSAPPSAGKSAASVGRSSSPPRDRLELSAIPPTRAGEGSTSGSDPVPSMTEVDFDNHKYRRSTFIPDYRETMFPDMPEQSQYTHEIPFAPQSTAASTRHSVWSAEPQKDVYYTNGYSANPSRRNSLAPIFAKKAAAESSDAANSVWRYSSSPSKTDLTNGNSNGVANGTVSRKTSAAPIFAQKAASAALAGAESGSSSRRSSASPGPILKARSGLVYGQSNLHNGDAPVLSPTADTDQSSIVSFKTANEHGFQSARRYSDGAGLTMKPPSSSYAVQPPMPSHQPNNADSRPSRRYSDLSALNGGYNSPRNVSPVDSRRSVAMGQISRSGAVSPITIHRSHSPLGTRPRNGTAASNTTGLVSPITARPNNGFTSSAAASIRSGSPGAQITSPLARNSMAPPASSTGATRQKLSLNTQMVSQQQQASRQSALNQLTANTPTEPNQPGTAQKSPTPSEAEEEMDEVIALSPAGRAPIQNFRRSRSSLMLGGGGGGASDAASVSGGAQSLNTLMETSPDAGPAGGKRYFGQDVNVEDLVAVNLENAFERL